MNRSKNSVIDKARPQEPARRRSARVSKGRSSYWLDATTKDGLCRPAQWKVRDSFEAALNDVRQACRRLDPDEFRLLMIDGVVTFRIVEETAERGGGIVWSWDWDETEPPQQAEPSILTASGR
jgi:hypothetical protein